MSQQHQTGKHKGAIGKNPGAHTWRPATQAVRGGTNRSGFGETSEALFLTAGYVYDSAEEAEARFAGEREGFVYSRFANPTVAMFEERMALLEGAEAAKATATGMAAVTGALLCQLSAGDHIVASRAMFGSCRYIVDTLLPRFGVEFTYVDGSDTAQWQAALRSTTKVLFLETPSNPTLEIVDLKAVADIAHQAGARLVVDNVFASPVLQKPMTFGADVVVYSATKHIDGQGRCMGGAIVSDAAFIEDHASNFLRQTGPALSPFNAWVLLKGLETMDLRVRQMSRNATEIAAFLADHPKVSRTFYPGHKDHAQHQLAEAQMEMGGTMVTMDIKGGKDSAFRLMNALSIIDISNNLGDSKSLITHPTTTTHKRLSDEEREELGVTPGLLRLSVGLEDVRDLREDLARALDAA